MRTLRSGAVKTRLEDLPVTVRLGRYDGGSKNGGFSLEIRCERSGLHIASVDLRLDDAADLFTGREVKAVAEYINDHENVGRFHDNRTVNVPTSDLGSPAYEKGDSGGVYGEAWMNRARARAVDMACAVWGEGWAADNEGYNHHRVKGTRGASTYAITVRRWTDEPPTPRPDLPPKVAERLGYGKVEL